MRTTYDTNVKTRPHSFKFLEEIDNPSITDNQLSKAPFLTNHTRHDFPTDISTQQFTINLIYIYKTEVWQNCTLA